MRRSPHAPALRAFALPLILLAGLASPLAGCAADDSDGAAPPERPADVDGTVDRDEGAPRLVEASDPYYEGMSLLSASTVVLTAARELATTCVRERRAGASRSFAGAVSAAARPASRPAS